MDGNLDNREYQILDISKLEKKTKELEAEVNALRGVYKDKDDYTRHLEALYIASVLHWTAMFDEVVHLRTLLNSNR